MAAEGGEAEVQQKEETKRHTYPLVRVRIFILETNLIEYFQTSDMNDELKTECMELCVTACEKFSQNNEVCINKMIFEYYCFYLECSEND